MLIQIPFFKPGTNPANAIPDERSPEAGKDHLGMLSTGTPGTTANSGIGGGFG